MTDIDVREHNRAEIEEHPMYKQIRMIEGSSVDEEMAQQKCGSAKLERRF